jgi:hypothetical protein
MLTIMLTITILILFDYLTRAHVTNNFSLLNLRELLN